MAGNVTLLYLPEVALEKIFSFLTYDEIARNRIVKEDDPLDALLSAANQVLGEPVNEADFKPPKDTSIEKVAETTTLARKLIETDIFCPRVDKPSVIHSGDTDSSDDEGNRNYENSKYNDYGKEIKSLLATSSQQSLNYEARKQTSSWKMKQSKNVLQTTPKLQSEYKTDVYTDPFFFIRIINPKISSTMLQERMAGREAVHMMKLSHFIQTNPKDKDWVIAGVIVNKSSARTSQKGSQYSIWTLSDLHGDIKTVSLFLFSGAHNNLWKIPVGTVVGVLNPNILDKRDGTKDEASLSIDSAQKVMIFGQSKDFGICKSTKKNGEKCTAIVNTNRCEFCVYHIKQEYQKCSLRSELQSNFTGRGLHALRNKVLGKNEVFYAGKSYMAIPAKKSRKLEQKDNNRLLSLNGYASGTVVSTSRGRGRGARKQNAARLDISPAQRMRDLELLKKLGGGLESKNNFSGIQSDGLSMEQAKQNAVSVINKLKSKQVAPREDPKATQYDMKMDLIVNVDNKTNFEGKTSENVSLDESRLAAVSLMSKLNPQTAQKKKDSPEDIIGTDFVDEMLDDDDLNLDYDDDFEDQPNKSVSTPKKQVGNSSERELDLEAKQQTNDTLQKNSEKIGENRNFEKALKYNTAYNSPSTKIEFKSTEKILQSLKPDATDISKEKVCNGSVIISATSQKIPAGSTLKSMNEFDEVVTLKLPKSNNSTMPKYTKESVSGKRMQISPTPNDTNTCSKVTKSKEDLTHKTDSVPVHVNKLAACNSGFSRPDLCSGSMLSKPKLSSDGFGTNSIIDLSKPVIHRRADKAKLNAIKLVQKTGPIQKSDPNNIRGSGKKRPLPELDNNPAKKSKLAESEFISDRFKRMMAATSKHMDLLEARDEEEKEKYFNKLEMKEKMEEKMTSTFKMACKAVKCLQCKYTSFSASDLCKKERHPLKVFDAVKRFFKCGNCGNRTVSLQLIPARPCNNCGSGKWERTGMMKEKIVTAAHSLSIRGGEQKFINSNIADADINLLVCRKFNEMGSKLLSRGFMQLEKKHAAIYKRVKSMLPRRESERRLHPMARHSDILQAVETRISMLNMTYMKYIEGNLLCFIPGKENKRLQEHTSYCKNCEILAAWLWNILTNTSCLALKNNLIEERKQSKTHKHHITFLTQSTQQLWEKQKRQNVRLKAQAVKLREQERKIQEQTTKIQEQEASLADIKKHIDEWDQKYKDLTSDLIRAKDDILSAMSHSRPSTGNSLPSPSPPKSYRSNIRPRMSHILPRSCISLQLELERKRKSNLLPEIPVKRNRDREEAKGSELTLKIPSLSDLQKEAKKDGDLPDSSTSRLRSDISSMISSSLENLLRNKLPGISNRKRKMTEDIDLK
nr:unnamed protein product [Callosobruchus analis]